MTISSAVGFIAVLLKAIPAAIEFFDKLAAAWEKQRAETQRQTQHEQIDKDRDAILSTGWVCPARCPHRGMHNAAPNQQNPGVKKPSGIS